MPEHQDYVVPLARDEGAPDAGAPCPRAVVARDPARRMSYVACASYYRSSKMGCEYPFESLPERDAMVLLDIDPGVVAFHSQPETFRWVDAGRARRYTPDILVERRDGGREYREVKPRKVRDLDPTLDGRLDRILIECAARGAAFAFWTKEEIQGQPRLSNAKRLRSSLDFVDEASVRIVRAAIAAERLPTTLGALARRLNGSTNLEATVLGLTVRGELAIDITLPLGGATPLVRGHAPGCDAYGQGEAA